VVPGLVQNSIRAETFALLAAVESINSGTFFSDCDYVVTTFKAILNGFVDITSIANNDIWVQIFSYVVARGPKAYHIIKVRAHNIEKPRTNQPFEWSWCNHVVDIRAKIANLNRPVHILATYKEISDNLAYQLAQMPCLIRHALEVYRFFEDKDKNSQQVAANPDQNENSHVPFIAPSTNDGSSTFPTYAKVQLDAGKVDARCTHGPTYSLRVLRYLSELEWPTNEEARQLCGKITQGDLLLDFVFSTHTCPPTRKVIGSKFTDQIYVWPELDPSALGDLTSMSRTFANVLKCLSKCHGHEVVPGMLKKGSATWMQTSAWQLQQSIIPHSPRTLLSSGKVAAWKA
jgi:hypothetical protein